MTNRNIDGKRPMNAGRGRSAGSALSSRCTPRSSRRTAHGGGHDRHVPSTKRARARYPKVLEPCSNSSLPSQPSLSRPATGYSTLIIAGAMSYKVRGLGSMLPTPNGDQTMITIQIKRGRQRGHSAKQSGSPKIGQRSGRSTVRADRGVVKFTHTLALPAALTFGLGALGWREKSGLKEQNTKEAGDGERSLGVQELGDTDGCSWRRRRRSCGLQDDTGRARTGLSGEEFPVPPGTWSCERHDSLRLRCRCRQATPCGSGRHERDAVFARLISAGLR